MNATPAGALLLCRAEPAAVRLPAHLLREPMLVAPAGQEWSVLVPEGRPWQEDGEAVDAVLGGWAAALSIGTGRPVLALWWDGDGTGFTMASGFRRPVGYIWLADGTPVGEDEAMRTFAARLGLDPVLDLQALEPLTAADPESDARVRLVGLTAVLTRHGLALPVGLAPGAPADTLRTAAHAAAVEETDSAGPPEPAARPRASRLRAAGAVQLAAGLALVALGARRRSGGWAAAGTVLIVQGLVPPVRERLRS
ncbi:hypothetical protein GLX30_12415 [Streptomyces sp. Tu 2975]|uniref:hypothetical protein n=1 Tax=Streptomyces sp. Tu 2975 TaxID=2676871 RepID=UPI00135821DA|nr:hypothetical protein [Streptomyces sp. Tu 2975]QIP84704.1 hypothetical protein GLX30_12415 [Streptomyces sp. Tu 2975]